MKKIMIGLAILTTPLYAAEMEGDFIENFKMIQEYLNQPSSIPALDSSLNDDVNTAKNFWAQNNELKNIFEAADSSFQLVEQHLADFENMNETSETWVGETHYNLFTSIRAALNEMSKLNVFLEMNNININEQMALTTAKIKRYQALAQAHNGKPTFLSNLLAQHSEEKLEEMKNTNSSKYHQGALVKSIEQGQTAMFTSMIKKDLGLPLTEDEKSGCAIM